MLVLVQLVRGVGFDGIVTTRSYLCSGVCGKGWKAWLVGVQLFSREQWAPLRVVLEAFATLVLEPPLLPLGQIPME